MEEEKTQTPESHEGEKEEYEYELVEEQEHPQWIIYRYLLRTGDMRSANSIMEDNELSRAQFYTGLKHLRDLGLIYAKIDSRDFRRVYYFVK